MKKLLLWVLVLVMSVLLVAVFSSAGCRPAVSAGEETVIQIPEGWDQFTGSGFELYLPEKWEGGSKEQLSSVVEKLKDAGQNQLASQVEAGLPYILFWAYDQDNPTTTVNIASEYSELSLEEYMDIGYEAMAKMYEESGYSFNIIEQDIVPLGNNEEVGRTIIDQTALGVKSRMVQYIIKPASDVWVLTFGTELGKFEQNIQTFDNIAKTFKIIE